MTMNKTITIHSTRMIYLFNGKDDSAIDSQDHDNEEDNDNHGPVKGGEELCPNVAPVVGNGVGLDVSNGINIGEVDNYQQDSSFDAEDDGDEERDEHE
jgi:hypothetical protein